MAAGAFCGMLLGIAVFAWQPEGLNISQMFILGMTLLGSLFGIWTGSMAGASVPNSRLKQFQQDMDAGRVLLMVDVPRQRIDEIQELIGRRHPEAFARGQEPSIPAFP